jgi:hypothetical protein
LSNKGKRERERERETEFGGSRQAVALLFCKVTRVWNDISQDYKKCPPPTYSGCPGKQFTAYGMTLGKQKEKIIKSQSDYVNKTSRNVRINTAVGKDLNY